MISKSEGVCLGGSQTFITFFSFKVKSITVIVDFLHSL